MRRPPRQGDQGFVLQSPCPALLNLPLLRLHWEDPRFSYPGSLPCTTQPHSSKAALRRLGVVVQSPCLALRNLTVTWGTAKTRAQSDYIQITFRVHSELQSELIQSMQIIALGDIRTIKRERLKSSFYRASSKSTIICKL